MPLKKIILQAQESTEEARTLELDLAGETYTVWEPTSGQIALVAEALESNDMGAATKGLKDFWRGLTDDDGYKAVIAVLANPNIPDSLEQVAQATRDVVEAFTTVPTKQPSDYLPSQKSTGQTSTAQRRQPGSTRSRSPQPGSSTTSTRSSRGT